ncbi:hypothetical protein [Priestia megaterium]|uniref:hypothetical protein n=1 Tax=Priestia megaterium TaxID=1404 RepID=UPI0030082150
MTQYEYEEKIKKMKEFKEKLIHENSLASTDPAQVKANEWRIQWIDSTIKKRKPVVEDESYATFNPVLDSLKNKGKDGFWSPKSLMSKRKP